MQERRECQAQFLPRILNPVVNDKADKSADLLPLSFPFQMLLWQLIIFFLDVDGVGNCHEWGRRGITFIV